MVAGCGRLFLVVFLAIVLAEVFLAAARVVVLAVLPERPRATFLAFAFFLDTVTLDVVFTLRDAAGAARFAFFFEAVRVAVFFVFAFLATLSIRKSDGCDSRCRLLCACSF